MVSNPGSREPFRVVPAKRPSKARHALHEGTPVAGVPVRSSLSAMIRVPRDPAKRHAGFAARSMPEHFYTKTSHGCGCVRSYSWYGPTRDHRIDPDKTGKWGKPLVPVCLSKWKGKPTMNPRGVFAYVLALGIGSLALAEERAPVAGSNLTFPKRVIRDIGEKEVPLVLTGTGLREKYFVNVYAVGSYIAADTDVKSAMQLASADIPKMLHLVFERNVDGAEMVDGLTTGITYNYSKSEFSKELAALGNYMRANPLRKGDEVWIVHVPGFGLSVKITGRDQSVDIKSMKFSRAVWDIYVGPKNLGRHIKDGLTSRL